MTRITTAIMFAIVGLVVFGAYQLNPVAVVEACQLIVDGAAWAISTVTSAKVTQVELFSRFF
jgi:hypothetical protein